MQKNRRKRQGDLKRKELKPKTENQFDYIRTIAESDVTLCCGPPGTGKTAVAVGIACEHLLSDKVKKIITGAIIIPIIAMSIERAVVRENRIEFFNEGDFKKCIP